MERKNKFEVTVSVRASQMLTSHAAFLAKFSPEAADRLIDAFEAAANSLEVMPRRCPWLDSEYIQWKTYRSLLFEKYYLLLFKVEENCVYVDYVVDCRQDYEWLIHS